MRIIRQILKSFNPVVTHGAFFRNVSWVFFSRFFSLAIQACYFILLTRALGVSQYGEFLSIQAFTAMLAYFSTCGTGELIVKDVSRDNSFFSESLGNSLFITLVFSVLLICLQLIGVKLILSSEFSFLVAFLVAASDIFFARIIDLVGKSFAAFNAFDKAVKVGVAFSFSKLIAIFAFIETSPESGISTWVLFYFLSTIISSALSLLFLFYSYGLPCLNIPKAISSIREGFYFSIGLAANTVYNDIDKAMLAKFSTLQYVGAYGAAYRLILIAQSPVSSVLAVSYRKFLKDGDNGIEFLLKIAKKMSAFSVIYGAIVAVFIFVVSPFIVYILGADYINAVEILRWLSPFVILTGVRSFGADVLTGAGYQKKRSILQIFAAIINILLNLILIPRFSWKGAVIATLLSEIFLLSSIWLTVYSLQLKNKRLRINEYIKSQ